MCTTSLKSSHRPKSMVSGAIFGGFDNQSGLCEGQLWHERVGWDCVCGFKSHKIHHYCLRTEMRQFNVYPKLHGLHNLAKILANVDQCELFWMVNLGHAWQHILAQKGIK